MHHASWPACRSSTTERRLKVFGALLDAAYNAGWRKWRAVCNSRMARSIHAGDWAGACNGFYGWYTTARDRKTGVRIAAQGSRYSPRQGSLICAWQVPHDGPAPRADLDRLDDPVAERRALLSPPSASCRSPKCCSSRRRCRLRRRSLTTHRTRPASRHACRRFWCAPTRRGSPDVRWTVRQARARCRVGPSEGQRQVPDWAALPPKAKLMDHRRDHAGLILVVAHQWYAHRQASNARIRRRLQAGPEGRCRGAQERQRADRGARVEIADQGEG
jgi:hypothetical protein